MIIFRYLARDLLSTTAAVAVVLLGVVMSGRFVQYLADAAEGKIDPDVVFAIMGYRMPGFLELILPLAFFLGVLLAYGRLYQDSEITVLHACGVSRARIALYTLVLAAAVGGCVALLSLWLTPQGMARAETLVDAQKNRGEFDLMDAGRFYPLRGGRGVSYAGALLPDGRMEDVFLVEAGADSEGEPRMVIVVAARGEPRRSETGRAVYLVLEDGYRYQGVPGRADFEITRFAEYGQRIPESARRQRPGWAESVPTRELRRSSDPAHIAALQWRYSTVLLVPIVTLLALPLSRTTPREGRFARILPAMVLYILYLLSLNAARGAMEDGELAAAPGLWAIHGVFVLLGAGLMLRWVGWWPPLRWGGSR
ncbi:MAG: LPS export ABC transporter permease LptF [Pseudomonadota bacterium]